MTEYKPMMVTQKGKIDFVSGDLSPQEIARKLRSVGIAATSVEITSPIPAEEHGNAKQG